MRKAVFFDRDGTINSDVGHYYIYKKEDFVLNEGVINIMRKLQESNFLLFVITNQGGVAKGIYSCEDVEKVNDYMLELLNAEGIKIENIYYCPHHESVGKCQCRKPSPFFINKAIKDYNLDKDKCFMIGDSKRDIESANAAGIKGLKIEANENMSRLVEEIINTNL